MNSNYVRQDLGGGRSQFIVTPGRVQNLKTDIILIVVWALVSLAVLGELPGLIAAAVGGWFIFMRARQWTGITAGAFAGGHFVASPEGIELPDGHTLERHRIEQLVVRNYASGAKAAVSETLYADTEGDGGATLAGGMDRATAARLLDEVCQIVGSAGRAHQRPPLRQRSAAAPAPEPSGIQPGDLWLTETSANHYELKRRTETGDEIAAPVPAPDNLVGAVTFAKEFAGDIPLWFSKLADTGPPVLVPKD
jgi:hypothetical protein